MKTSIVHFISNHNQLHFENAENAIFSLMTTTSTGASPISRLFASNGFKHVK